MEVDSPILQVEYHTPRIGNEDRLDDNDELKQPVSNSAIISVFAILLGGFFILSSLKNYLGFVTHHCFFNYIFYSSLIITLESIFFFY